MSYNLFLDDCRDPQDVTWVELPLVNWTVVKSFDEFVRHVSAFGMPKRVTFDHDLADEHYREYVWMGDSKNLHRGTFQYDKMKEKTGYHCVKWLVNYCMDRGETFPEYYVHTMNPVGKDNIIQYIESFKKSGEV